MVSTVLYILAGIVFAYWIYGRSMDFVDRPMIFDQSGGVILLIASAVLALVGYLI
jgi:hypothetical protein